MQLHTCAGLGSASFDSFCQLCIRKEYQVCPVSLWQQGVTSSVFQELTDVWPDPIFVPKVAIA